MVIHSLGKQRESLTFSSENHKALVRKYMETMGYSQLTDSYVEGHLSDMVFVNPDISVGKYFRVEDKATSIGPNDKKFTVELLDYLIEWLNLPEDKKFELFIFAEKLNDKQEFQKLFGAKYSVKNLRTWLNKHKKHLSKEKQSIIKKAKFSDIVSFFSRIEIFEGDVNHLTAAIEEKNKTCTLSLKRYAENLLLDTKRRGKAIRKKNILSSNLVLVEPPKKYYVAKSKYKLKEKIYDIFNKNGIELPPFSFYPEKQTISSFIPFNDSNPLTSVIEGKVDEVEYAKSEVNQQFVKSLINQHLKRIFWKKGLRRITKSNVYFFECPEKDGKYSKRQIQIRSGKMKDVSVPYYKGGTKELNFVFHHAAEIKTKIFWGQYYVQIIPKREYTTNGVNLIEGTSKDAIDRTFRNPLYNRTPNKLSEVKAWHYYLFKSPHFEKPKESWFGAFKFDKLKSLPFNWSPETVKKGQALLEEYREDG